MEQDILAGFPVAQPWSLFTGKLGTALVVAGLVAFVVAALAAGFQHKKPPLSKVATLGFWAGSLCLFGAFAALTALFVKDQFQYSYVFARADVHTDLKYKIAGVWSGQQGSFLLWACCSALFGLMALRGTAHYRRWYVVVFSVFLGALCGILAYETPFHLMHEVMRDGKVHVPPTGNGMTPSLQNYWVVIHPPTIFLGFGVLTVLFAYAVSAMLNGDLGDWIARVRPWALLGLAMLGLGLCMGGFWAYETLGWGGFWAWDPVENTSFVPWVFLAILAHGMIVQTTRKRWHGVNLWMAALPFLSFCYGTFLTRSGFLTEVSVHSFAQMEKSALVILEVLVAVAVLSFLVLYVAVGRRHAKRFNAPPDEAGVGRESMYGAGALLLSLLAAMIAVGMSWPVLLALAGRKSAVIEEATYHQVVTWFFVPIMLLMAIAPFVSWRGLPLRQLVGRVVNVFSVSAGLTGFAMLALNHGKFGVPMPPEPWINATLFAKLGFNKIALMPWIAFLLFLCMFVAVASVWRTLELVRRSPGSLGGFVAHFGLAMLMAGLILSRGLESHERGFFRPNEVGQLLGYTFTYKGFTDPSLRSRENKVLWSVTTPSGKTFEARPGLYYFRQGDGSDGAMVWPHIERALSHDVYMAIREPVIFAWKEPVWFKPGEKKTIDGVTVTYRGLKTHGEPGQPGTAFGADLVVEADGGRYEVEPQMVVGGEPTLPHAGPNYQIAMTQIEAADKSAAIQLLFSPPIYPIELFYKPLTILVWVGTGILTLGGLMAAWARRRRPRTAPGGFERELEEQVAEVQEPERVTV